MVGALGYGRAMDDTGTATFGFDDIAKADKPGRVQGVFRAVAPRYDLMNDLMSGGVHRLWRRAFLDTLAPRPGLELLDLAGGTGDIALRVLKRVDGQAAITVCDLSAEMLEVGRDRAVDAGWLNELEWVCGAAEALPLESGRFDACTIAFGLRNTTDIPAALAEARRVLKPAGRFLCLEFSQVVLPALRDAYDRYSFSVLPRLGQLVAGDRDAYQYLVESIRRFPDQETLAGMMTDAGFAQVSVTNLSGGIAAIHSGWRV